MKKVAQCNGYVIEKLYTGDVVISLHTCSLHGSQLIFELLFFFLPHQMTPLHLAAKDAHIKIVKYLISKEDTDINIQDHKGVIVTMQNTVDRLAD